MHIEIF